jgi:HEPN domain-containing protein/predicted nucleotidyltransferase
MASKRPPTLPEPTRYYHGPGIPLRVIRRYARQVAERFSPDKIILFGSYAYGNPHADSDVDLLVIMPARNELDLAAKIRWEIPAPFPMDLIVCTPHTMEWRLEEGDWFLKEIVAKGKVLYEKAEPGMGAKGRNRPPRGRSNQRPRSPVHDAVCFHSQQCAEKYLKALLQEFGLPVPRTHDLDMLLTLLRPHHPSLQSLRRGLTFLSEFAVDVRYPRRRTKKRQAVAALRWANRVRDARRTLLGIRSS